ncbi:MAG: restriction endonuclease subunit S [Deltaproteobacteria bacterium]|nr:restriction endonuclease subunit S [Deltaproteobacteria bacterium]
MGDSPQLLPQGWTRTTVGEIFDIRGGGTPPTENPAFWDGSIPWMTSADIHGLNDIKPRKKITLDAVEKSATHCVPKGSIIVVTRVGLGKIALAPTDLCFSQDCQALIGNWNNLVSEYCLYYLSEAVQIFKYKNQGTTISGVTVKQLRELEFPLPPLHEQLRIVTKIEELFTQLDAGVASLKKVQAQLRRYRQAVLKAAFEGRLTQEWREEHKGEIEPANVLLERIKRERQKLLSGKIKETTIDLSDLQPLPDSWAWVRIDDIAHIKGGITKDGKRIVDKGRLVPYLRVANVQNGHLDLSKMKTIEANEEEIRNLSLKFGDILFTEGGDRDKLGRGWIWENEIPECIYQNHIFRARVYLDEISSKYISWFGNTHSEKYFMKKGKQTTNLASISLTQLRAFPVALPPSEEQQTIVNEIERHFSQIDHLEQTITTSLRQAETLRQSILKRAFEGKLVPQNPNDEPASILLERIKAEKTHHAAEVKKGKTLQPKSPKRKIKNGN